MARFIGGPKDGQEMEIQTNHNGVLPIRLVFPGIPAMVPTWFAEDEAWPMETDPITGEPRMKRLPIEDHVYDLAGDGIYRYAGIRSS